MLNTNNGFRLALLRNSLKSKMDGYQNWLFKQGFKIRYLQFLPRKTKNPTLQMTFKILGIGFSSVWTWTFLSFSPAWTLISSTKNQMTQPMYKAKERKKEDFRLIGKRKNRLKILNLDFWMNSSSWLWLWPDSSYSVLEKGEVFCGWRAKIVAVSNKILTVMKTGMSRILRK